MKITNLFFKDNTNKIDLIKLYRSIFRNNKSIKEVNIYLEDLFEKARIGECLIGDSDYEFFLRKALKLGYIDFIVVSDLDDEYESHLNKLKAATEWYETLTDEQKMFCNLLHTCHG